MSTHTPTTARPSPRPQQLPQTGDTDEVAIVDDTGMAPLRSHLFLLTPLRRSPGKGPLLHFVVEESPERAADLCMQSYPGHRILSMRDVTDEATAA